MSITVSKTFENEADAAAWLSGKGGSAASGKPASTPAADKPKPKNNREQMTAVMNKLKELSDADTCRALMTEACGKPTKMAEATEDQFDGIVAKANAKIAAIEKAKADAADEV